MREDRRSDHVPRIVGWGIALVSQVLVDLLSDSMLSAAIAAGPPTTILILQHAERLDFTKTDNDPELTAGRQAARPGTRKMPWVMPELPLPVARRRNAWSKRCGPFNSS